VEHEQADRGGVVLDLLEKALVSRVKRRLPILIERLDRSTMLLLFRSFSGSPVTTVISMPAHSLGL
jgi:hypothetical protein